MTSVYLNPVLAACMFKAEERMGPGGAWVPGTGRQFDLVKQLPALRQLLTSMPAGMLKSIGSTNADAINEFFAAQNIDIRVRPLSDRQFATGAVLDILTKWRVAGAEEKLYCHDIAEVFPGVEMKGQNVDVTVTGDGVEVIAPHTDDVGKVLLVEAESLEIGMALINSPRTPYPDKVKRVNFPMVDFSASVDIDWVVGMSYGENVLTQAFAQAKLRLNAEGAHAKAAAAIVLTRSFELSRSIVIDKPFVVAFMIDDQIAVAFHVTRDDWKKPPSLGSVAPTPGDTW